MTRNQKRHQSLIKNLILEIKQIFRLLNNIDNTTIMTTLEVKRLKSKQNINRRRRTNLCDRRIKMFSQFQADWFMIGENCICCHDSIQVGMHLVRLDCNHVMCNVCTDIWFSDKNTCPVCRHVFK